MAAMVARSSVGLEDLVDQQRRSRVGRASDRDAQRHLVLADLVERGHPRLRGDRERELIIGRDDADRGDRLRLAERTGATSGQGQHGRWIQHGDVHVAADHLRDDGGVLSPHERERFLVGSRLIVDRGPRAHVRPAVIGHHLRDRLEHEARPDRQRGDPSGWSVHEPSPTSWMRAGARG